MTRSANDAAVVIAEWIGDDEESFAEMMTKKARALGMMHTVYKNASGLPDDEQVTTARDQAILGRAIQEHFPRYYKFFQTRTFSFRGHSIRNHNSLLGRVPGVDGIKTGYVRASGFNLVTSVHRGNRYVVAVVMGGSSASSRDARMRSLLDDWVGEGATKRTVAMIPRPIAEPEEPEAATEVATTIEPKDEPKAEAKPEPKTAIKAEPKAEPKVAAQAKSKAGSKDQHRFAVASAGATILPSPASEPARRVTAGSSEPIRPVMVKTVPVRAGPAKAGALVTFNVPVAETPRVLAAVQPSAPSAPSAAPPQRAAAVATAEPPTASTKPKEPVAAAPAKPVRSGWIIQVGAFTTDGDAKERLSAVQSKAAKMLAGTDPFTETVDKGGSTFYRARFAGLDKDRAEAACKFLKRNDVECVTIRN